MHPEGRGRGGNERGSRAFVGFLSIRCSRFSFSPSVSTSFSFVFECGLTRSSADPSMLYVFSPLFYLHLCPLNLIMGFSPLVPLISVDQPQLRAQVLTDLPPVVPDGKIRRPLCPFILFFFFSFFFGVSWINISIFICVRGVGFFFWCVCGHAGLNERQARDRGKVWGDLSSS